MTDDDTVNNYWHDNINDSLDRATRLANAAQWCDAAEAASEAIRYIHSMPMDTNTSEVGPC